MMQDVKPDALYIILNNKIKKKKKVSTCEMDLLLFTSKDYVCILKAEYQI